MATTTPKINLLVWKILAYSQSSLKSGSGRCILVKNYNNGSIFYDETTSSSNDSDVSAGTMSRKEKEAQAELVFNVITQSQKEAFDWDNAVEPHDTELFHCWHNGTIVGNSTINYPKVPE